MEPPLFSQFDLGKQGIDYIWTKLSRGKTLSSCLLQLPLEKGQVLAFLPSGISYEAAHRFHDGKIGPYGSIPRTLKFVADHMEGQSRTFLVFESPVSLPSDRGIQESEHVFFYDSEVYHFVSSYTRSQDLVDERLIPVGWPCIGVLSYPDNDPGIAAQQTVSKETLEELAIGAKYILIGAYDDESFLIWSRE